MQVTSPIKYLGNLEEIADDIFDLIGSKKQYACFYDLFSGSASITLQAIENNLANKYIINDAYPPLAQLWNQIAENPNVLLNNYRSLVNNLLRKNSITLQKEYYTDVQTEFNFSANESPSIQAARFIFILNYSADGIPYLSNGKLNCSLAASALPQDVNVFAKSIQQTHALFTKPGVSVEFTSQNFIDFIPVITADDFVFIDPPFPDLQDASESPDSHIYYRTEPKQSLTDLLNQLMKRFNAKNIQYICVYGLYQHDDKYQLTGAQVHLIRLLALVGCPTGSYPVNVYLAQSLVKQPLPRHFRARAEISQYNTGEIIDLLTAQPA